jgi:hypothetical protein
LIVRQSLPITPAVRQELGPEVIWEEEAAAEAPAGAQALGVP